MTDRELERAARRPGDDEKRRRIEELERQLDELRSTETGKVQVVERPIDVDRLTALERRLEDAISQVRSAGDQRPAIQVIQRTEVDTGKKKKEPTPGEEKAQQVIAWGCAIAMVLFMAAMCFGASALVVP